MLDPPTEYSLVKGFEELYAYGVITSDFELSEAGKKIGELSLDIKLATMLVSSFDARFGCSE